MLLDQRSWEESWVKLRHSRRYKTKVIKDKRMLKWT